MRTDLMIFVLIIAQSLRLDQCSRTSVYFNDSYKVFINNDESPVLNCTEFYKNIEEIKRQNEIQAKRVYENEEFIQDGVPDYYSEGSFKFDVNPSSVRFSEDETNQIQEFFNVNNPDYVREATNANPKLINELNDCQLHYSLTWKEVITKLKDKTIEAMMVDKKLAKRFETIPHKTLATMIQMRPGIVKNFHLNFPAKNLFKKLLKNRKFVKMLSRDFIADAVEVRNVRQLLDRISVSIFLNIHPDLPEHLGKNGLHWGFFFFLDPNFIDSLNCAVFLNVMSNTTFVDQTPAKVMKTMSGNKNFWNCLPVETIRHMMRTTKLGAKLDLPDIMEAAKTMSIAKSMDLQVVQAIFRIQFPQMISQAESSFYDWFNAQWGKKQDKVKHF